MAGIFAYSSTRPRTISRVLLVIGAVFLLMGLPLVAYGFTHPSTLENEMLPFILSLCGLMLTATGLGMLVIGVRVRLRFPAG